MSNLRQCLKLRETYLAIFCLLLVLLVVDTFRGPEKQVTGRLYVGGVRAYQLVGRPLLQGRIECRFHPTCSDYSIEAVQKYGIRHGIVLTYRRINSCEANVPRGTLDPVPPAL